MSKRRKVNEEAGDHEGAPKDKGHVLMGFNPRLPHKKIVGKDTAHFVQNGILYEAGSFRPIGPVSNAIKVENENIIVDEFSGATFPNTPKGREAMEHYRERKGISKGMKPGEEALPASSLEERKEVISERREELFAQEGRDKDGRYPDGVIPVE